MGEREFDLASFAAFATTDLEHSIEVAKKDAFVVMAAMIAAEARDVIGTYRYGWPQLAESTQDERTYLGFEPNEPLLRTGSLRDSIGFRIHSSEEAEVGTDHPIAPFLELGTVHIPPRSFLVAAATRKEQEAVRAAGKIIAEAIRVAGTALNIEREIWRLALEAARELGHLAHDLLEGEHGEQQADPVSDIRELGRGVGHIAHAAHRALK
jgi:hypothetical protein